MERKETPSEYAARRAKETGRAYIVSNFPRVLMDCRHNRQVLRELGETIVERFTR